MAFAKYTAPGLTLDEGKEISEVLQSRLHDLNELHLSLKHAHWNVTGPGFIAVHEMIDPQVDTVRNFVDDIAERMATLGATPQRPRRCPSRSTQPRGLPRRPCPRHRPPARPKRGVHPRDRGAAQGYRICGQG